MISATGIAFAVYVVTDIDRARRFYRDALGLTIGMDQEVAPGFWWIEIDLGPSALGLTNLALPGANSTRSPGVTIEVNDFDAALAQVQGAGIPVFWGPNDFPVCRSFGIKDPDGNDLYFHQRKPAP
jgi:predicted enzyme related to lactoylglutathione lyase